MREPKHWLGHLPVTKIFHNVGQFEKKHEQHLHEALSEASVKHSKVLEVIPKSGFYVEVISGPVGNELLSSFQVLERIEDLVSPKNVMRFAVIKGAVYQSTGALHHAPNPFACIFAEAAAKLPAEWDEYLKWRRRQRWKPVPEWLIELRAEERKAKRRKKPSQR